MDSAAFRHLLRKVRAGDAEAAATLVRHFEPAIRRHIRVLLTSQNLRRLLDSVDICQSVLANFFFRAAAGQFDLQHPEQLVRLLATMAHNRVVSHARHAKTGGRDGHGMPQTGSVVLRGTADPSASPDQVAAGREMLDRAMREFTAAERTLVDQRLAGRSWEEIAGEQGRTADAVRKQYARALDRVSAQLGL